MLIAIVLLCFIVIFLVAVVKDLRSHLVILQNNQNAADSKLTTIKHIMGKMPRCEEGCPYCDQIRDEMVRWSLRRFDDAD